MNYPKHVAIIPDWNRTRATENNKTIQEWYLEWYQRWIELLKYTFTETDIEIFTLRWLSKENVQKRSKNEIDFLMTMYKIVDDELIKFLVDSQINFKRIGNSKYITQDFIDDLNNKQKITKCNTNKYFVFAVSYSWRDEIMRAVEQIIKDWKKDLNEDEFSKYLDLWNLPNVELVIRTKWDFAQRTSGFMSRRIWYAELYFTEIKCPDFGVEDYKKALVWFNQVQKYRNFWK